MAREANVFIRDPQFAADLRLELVKMIEEGSRSVAQARWTHRSRLAKAISWIAYGIVRVSMGILRYGGNEWWKQP